MELDELVGDPKHPLHGTTKGFLLGCPCARCQSVAGEVADRLQERLKPLRWTDEEAERLIRMYEAGIDIGVLATAFERSRRSVHSKLGNLRKAGRVGRRTTRPEDVTHGSVAMYKRGCRCDACREAMKLSLRKSRGTAKVAFDNAPRVTPKVTPKRPWPPEQDGSREERS